MAERPGVTYGLTLAVLAKSPFLEIEPETFEGVKRAKRIVFDCLGSEEAFNLVLGNYLEYETELLDGAMHLLVYTEGSWSEFTGRIHDVNRRVLNLLAGGRAYLDQTCHYLAAFFGKDSDELRTLRSWTAGEYDESLGYRAMEALRNFALHRSIAVHRLTHEIWRESPTGTRRSALVPSIQPHRFKEEGGFKASVLEELTSLGEVVDLRPLIREYVVGLARIHDQVRALMITHVTEAEQRIYSLIETYETDAQPETLGLAAVKCAADGRWLETIELFADPIARRRSLVGKMRRVRFVDKLYTTNEPKGEWTGGSA